MTRRRYLQGHALARHALIIHHFRARYVRGLEKLRILRGAR